MSTLFQRVQPGDLITAADMNDLFTEIESLEARVAALEGGGSPPEPSVGAVTITSMTPDPVVVGQTLTIVGTNFGLSTASNSVLFNGTPAFNTLSGSTDSLLIVTVPDLGASSPQQVTVTVSNAFTSAHRTITVNPAHVQQQGSVQVVFAGADPDPITAGTTNDFQFQLTDQLTVHPSTVSLSPNIGGQAWQATLLDNAKNPIPGHQVTFANHGDQKTVYVRLTIPQAANGTAFSVRLDAAYDNLSSSSGDGNYTVGQFADPDPSFTIAAGAAPGIISGNTVTANSASQFATRVPIVASMTLVGTYDVTASLVPANPTGWNQPTVVAPPATGSPPAHKITIAAADLGSPPQAVPEQIAVTIKPQSASAASAQLRVTVQREGASQSRTLTFNLVAS